MATGQVAGSSEQKGAELAEQLRTQRPTERFATTGLLRQRTPDGKWQPGIQIQFEVVPTPDGWQSIYRASSRDEKPVEVLVVAHRSTGPNIYYHTRFDTADAATPIKTTLVGDETFVPFANSEFWVADLGVEFLHWPLQRLAGSQMRKGRACYVLESSRRNPQKQFYARVLSWIDVEYRGILRAEAYDWQNRLLKEFNIGSFRKVNGRWQLKSMEVRNERTDARTRIEFDLEIPE